MEKEITSTMRIRPSVGRRLDVYKERPSESRDAVVARLLDFYESRR